MAIIIYKSSNIVERHLSEVDCSGNRPKLEMQLAQKICIIVLRMAKRSVSDLLCSDVSKRTVTKGTRSCAEDMSFVIEDWKMSTIWASRQAIG